MSFSKPKRTIFEAEHESFRSMVRLFLESEAKPRFDQWLSDGVIDRAFWREAAALGLVGFAAPVEFGGVGISDFRYNAILNEEVVYSGVGTDAFSLTNDIVAPYLINLTDEEQKARWLPGLTEGSLAVAIAMTEPAAGSDLRGIQSRAVWKDGAYELSGSKTFITNGTQADLVIVAAHVDREGMNGMGLFVVEANMPGFSRGRKLEKIGRRAQDTAELFFDNVRVPASNVLGVADQGLRLLMQNLAQERLSIAITAIADAEHVLEFTVDYVEERRAFGAPIGRLQSVRFAVAEMVTEVRIGRSYIDQCIQSHVKGTLTGDEAAGAKAWLTDLEWKVLDQCLQLHGGYGYMEEYEIARRWRDARVTRIYGGTNEIMKEIVGRSVGL
jgi:alkylation response protein AidB-like acyl-CoA dehydrogenase